MVLNQKSSRRSFWRVVDVILIHLFSVVLIICFFFSRVHLDLCQKRAKGLHIGDEVVPCLAKHLCHENCRQNLDLTPDINFHSAFWLGRVYLFQHFRGRSLSWVPNLNSAFPAFPLSNSSSDVSLNAEQEAGFCWHPIQIALMVPLECTLMEPRILEVSE